MRFKPPYKLVMTSLFLIALICCPLSSNRALALGPDSASQGQEANASPTITVEEAEALINLLPPTKELRAKGMVVKWDVQAGPTMNNKDLGIGFSPT
jgi:hypothetical protein